MSSIKKIFSSDKIINSAVFILFSVAGCSRPECDNCLRSEDLVFMHKEIPVDATITLPDRTGKFPAIILTPGSGACDRDLTRKYYTSEDRCLYPLLNNTTITPYKELAEALSSRGYIVLRYDKPQYTYPLSVGFIGVKSFERIWLTTNSAIDYLKSRSEVDTNKIILAGHSEGSYLIPFIAMRRSNIKALISLGGPLSPIDSLVAYQMNYLKDHCYFPGYDYDGEGTRWLTYFTGIRNDLWNSDTPNFNYVPATVWHDYVHMMDATLENYNSCNLPSLFIAFESDWNVPPGQQERLKRSITIPADFRMIKGLIHMMVPPDSPHIPGSLSDTITAWLRKKRL